MTHLRVADVSVSGSEFCVSEFCGFRSFELLSFVFQSLGVLELDVSEFVALGSSVSEVWTSEFLLSEFCSSEV